MFLSVSCLFVCLFIINSPGGSVVGAGVVAKYTRIAYRSITELIYDFKNYVAGMFHQCHGNNHQRCSTFHHRSN